MTRTFAKPPGPGAFRALWSATAATNVADGIFKISLPLLAVSLTGSPALIAAASFLNTLPWLLFALLAGAVADRIDRRRLMAGLNLVRVVVTAVLTGTLALDVGTLPVLYVCAFLLGLCETFVDTTRMAVVQAVVPRQKLENAYARLTATETVANEFAGPPAGGALAAVALALTAGASSLGYLIATLALLLMPGHYRPAGAAAPPPLRTDIAEGLRYVWRQRTLRILLAGAGVSTACWAGWLAVFPLYALRSGPLGLSPGAYGLLIGALGVGGTAGAFLARPLGRLLGRRRLLVGALLAVTAMMLAPALSTGRTVVATATLAGGIGSGAWNVSYSTLRAMVVPGGMMGRYSGVSRLVTFGAMPLGAAAAGAIAETLNVRAAFFSASVAMTLTVVLVLGTITPARLRTIEDHGATGS